METEQILQLRERTEELRKIESRAAKAVENGERKELDRTARNLRRQVSTLQKNVLSTYNSDFVTCRDIGHRWTVKEAQIESGELVRTLVCDCGMLRHESFSRMGDMTHRSYTPPEEYYLPSQITGAQRYTKQFWRGITFMATSRS